MKRELVYLKPELYSQLPREAWLNPDNSIGVDFAEQKWIVDGDAGIAKPSAITEKSVVEIYGTPMSLVSIRRLARVIIDPTEELVPILRHSQCRIPVAVVREAGVWKRPSLRPIRERSR